MMNLTLIQSSKQNTRCIIFW